MNPDVMNPDHALYAHWDSAYVLGALSPAQRREFEEHLESCETCRRSVAELTSIPGLLSRLSPERALALLDEPGQAPAARAEMLEAVRQEGRRRHVRRWRLRLGLLAAAVAVLLGVTLVTLVPLAVGRPAADAQTFGFETVADIPFTASAILTPVGWGTRIDLACAYRSDVTAAPAEGWPYALFVVDRDGRRSEVSSWRAMAGATARLEAGTAMDLGDIASLEIRAVGSGDVLMLGVAD